MGSPLWKRGVRGDFVKSFDSIGALHSIFNFLEMERGIKIVEPTGKARGT
jgi:hypothetical protein